MLWIVLAVVLLLILAVAWVGVRGALAKGHLERAVADVSTLRSQLSRGDTSGAQGTAARLEDEASAARSLTSDPIWATSEYVPFFGTNLRAVRQIAGIVDDVSSGAVAPVSGVVGELGSDSFAPKDGKVDLEPLKRAQAPVQQAATTISKAAKDAGAIDVSGTLSPVTSAVNQLRNALHSVEGQVDVANRVVQLAPAMLGADGDRRYLLLFQNNAELRAGGGIPGAVALLNVQDGGISLQEQRSGSRSARTRSPSYRSTTRRTVCTATSPPATCRTSRSPRASTSQPNSLERCGSARPARRLMVSSRWTP